MCRIFMGKGEKDSKKREKNLSSTAEKKGW